MQLAPEPAAERVAVAFSRLLRAAGIDVPVGNVIVFAEALGAVGVSRATGVYWAGRSALLRRPEDTAAYDRAFVAFWRDGDAAGGTAAAAAAAADSPLGTPSTVVSLLLDTAGPSPDDTPPDDDQAPPPGPVLAVRWSPTEILRHKDFSAYSTDEHDEARRLMADLRLVGALRRSRRWKAARRRRRHGAPDLRRTVRSAIRSGGEPVRRAWREPGVRPRRIVLLLDVSGSMEPYARALVRFVHAAVVGRGRVEAFALGTRLTRITRELSWRDPDTAIAQAADAVLDWSGGTRLGEGLRRFNDRYGAQGMARGAIVVVLSDGWDRGDPQLLGSEMARLRRVAHRVVWVNPLKAGADYAPLAGGMAAALPHVDAFVEGHSLAALESLAQVIGAE